MEKQRFLITCGEVSAFHIPRWHELPEFDLYMDQVIALAEKYLSVLSADGKGLLTPSMINNYVKSGVLPPPKNKKYNRTHLAILMIVCITKIHTSRTFLILCHMHCMVYKYIRN